MTVLSYIQLSTEVIALITSVVYFTELKAKGWLIWIPFLLYTCLVELWGSYLAHFTDVDSNLFLYNPYIIISVAFYAWFLIQITISDIKVKKRIHILLYVYYASCMLWYLIWGNQGNLITLILNIGALIICLLCLAFFYTQIRNSLRHDSLMKIPGFWIAAGLLIFYTGISLYIAVYDQLVAAQIIIWDTTIQNLIPQILSLFLYPAITIGIIQCKYQLKT